jgi:3-dehydroquinate synthase
MIKLDVSIPTPVAPYPIYIGNELLANLPQLVGFDQYSKVGILTDTHIATALLPQVHPHLPHDVVEIQVEPGEANKAIGSVQLIWQQLMEQGFDRKSLLINLGGGVISDVGSFAASTYMRGISIIQMPTTLLSMVDASVGGKTGINFGGLKNLVGTFSHPKMIVMDVTLLKTLPDREYNSGFAEIIKHGLIADPDYFAFVTVKKPREFTEPELMNIIETSCKIKSKIVSEDVNEVSGKRKLLNYGHTIGHAVESLMLEANVTLLHGEAIAIGMVAEAQLSFIKNFITPEHVEKIRSALTKAGLPISIKNIQPESILEKIKKDKKNNFGKVKWTLLRTMGLAVADCDATEQEVKTAIQSILA